MAINNKRIASNLMRDPAMAGNDFRDSSERILNALVSERLIQLNERGRADHIGVQDDSELTYRLFSHEKPGYWNAGARRRRYYREWLRVASERQQSRLEWTFKSLFSTSAICPHMAENSCL